MRLVASVLVLLTCALGCVTRERIASPPTPAELARVDDAVAHGRSLVVDYSPRANPPGRPPPKPPACDIGPCPTPVEPVCASPACAELTPAVTRPAQVIAADPYTLTFGLRDGGRARLPLDRVDGLKVTGYGRGRGALIGASIGAGVTASTLLVLVLALDGPKGSSLVPGQPYGCDSKCRGLFGLITIEGAILGGIVGAVIGTSHEFRLGSATDGASP
jgi:hypothetical protein